MPFKQHITANEHSYIQGRTTSHERCEQQDIAKQHKMCFLLKNIHSRRYTMSATMKYNLKNPGVKRIMQEAKELANESTYEYSAHPLEDNIFEWHFTVRGPQDTDFEEGRYHGRIILPNEYPFKPPELVFLTPNGRFELNTKICLSITGFHPEFWQPAWGIRTVLLAVIGFFPTEARGAIGGLDYTKDERHRLAKKSVGWICPVCNINTKDALSDTLPDLPSRKEYLPEFKITYKPDNEEKREPDNAIIVAESSKSTSHNDAQPSATTTYVAPDEKSRIADSETLVAAAESPQIVQARILPINDTANTVSSNASNSATSRNVGSPIWLDALIAGLISFIVVLVCRSHVF
ncbi:ubiquitin-conjugating enzyme/RWD-like protein [Parasitella parasitica]|nr:ubiquitin-conjugating enzyme/RWD-like protein [Parasitella parasitica]